MLSLDDHPCEISILLIIAGYTIKVKEMNYKFDVTEIVGAVTATLLPDGRYIRAVFVTVPVANSSPGGQDGFRYDLSSLNSHWKYTTELLALVYTLTV